MSTIDRLIEKGELIITIISEKDYHDIIHIVCSKNPSSTIDFDTIFNAPCEQLIHYIEYNYINNAPKNPAWKVLSYGWARKDIDKGTYFRDFYIVPVTDDTKLYRGLIS
jgi:hypothetical protein